MRRLWRRPRLGACGDCGLRGLSTVGCGCAAAVVAAAGALTTAVTPVAAAARGMLLRPAAPSQQRRPGCLTVCYKA